MLYKFSNLKRGHTWLMDMNLEGTLPAKLESCGLSLETSNYDWHGLERKCRDQILFQYTVSGKGQLQRGGKTWHPQAGEFMLLPLPDDHRYSLTAQNDPWETLYFTLKGKSTYDLLSSTIETFGPVHQASLDSPLLQRIIRMYTFFTEQEVSEELINSSEAWQLATAIAQHIQKSRALPQQPLFERLSEWVDSHLEQDIGIDNMAEFCGYSRYHFSRLFSEHLGLSPRRYLESRRIRRATQLLLNQQLSVSEVARACGYRDPNYFTRVFHQKTGRTPREFRTIQFSTID